jgi:hypothetical protein
MSKLTRIHITLRDDRPAHRLDAEIRRLARELRWLVCLRASEWRVAANRARRQPPEVRAKIGASKKGKPRPPEVRAAISATLKGRKLAPVHRMKISKAHVERAKG